MGFLERFERPAPATTIEGVEEAPEITVIDEEKAHGELHENGTPTTSSHHVNPEIEKAVVRKLDWRVPPLLGALCMF